MLYKKIKIYEYKCSYCTYKDNKSIKLSRHKDILKTICKNTCLISKTDPININLTDLQIIFKNLIYYEDKFYDITPLATAITGATLTSTQNSNAVTVTKASHGLDVGEYITFTAVTLPGGGATSFTTANFKKIFFNEKN